MLSLGSAEFIEVAENIKTFEIKLERLMGQKVKLLITELNQFAERNVFTEALFMQKVIEATAKFGGVSVSELKGKSRETPLPDLRYIAYTIIKDTYPKVSHQNIGELFGGRDHSSVSHGLDKFKDMWSLEPPFREKYLTIKKTLNNG